MITISIFWALVFALFVTKGRATESVWGEAMNATSLPALAVEAPPYVALQREMHDALLRQHPEWMERDPNLSKCDEDDRRFARLLSLCLTSSPLTRTRGCHAMTRRFTRLTRTSGSLLGLVFLAGCASLRSTSSNRLDQQIAQADAAYRTLDAGHVTDYNNAVASIARQIDGETPDESQ